MDHGPFYELFNHATFWEQVLLIALMLAVLSR